MQILLLFFLGALLLGIGNCAFTKEEVSEGECLENTKPFWSLEILNFALKAALSKDWMHVMGSYYGIRYHAEIIRGYAAMSEDELSIKEGANLEKVDVSTGNVFATAFVKSGNRLIKVDVYPAKGKPLGTFVCEVKKGTVENEEAHPHGKLRNTDKHNQLELIGKGLFTIIALDFKHNYVVLNGCSINHHQRYWLAFSPKLVTPEVEGKIRKEVFNFGIFNLTNIFVAKP